LLDQLLNLISATRQQKKRFMDEKSREEVEQRAERIRTECLNGRLRIDSTTKHDIMAVVKRFMMPIYRGVLE